MELIKRNREYIYILAGYTLLFIVFRYTFFYTLPFLLGLGFAAVMQPVYRHLCKAFKIKKLFSAAVVTTMIFLILISVVCILSVMLINQLLIVFSEIMENNQAINNIIIGLFDKVGATLTRFDFNLIPDGDNLMDSLSNGLKALQTVSGYLMSIASFIPAAITMIIVSVFSTYYFTVNYSKLELQTKRFIKKYNIQKMYSYISEGKMMLKRFLRGYLILYGITFVITLVFFLTLRVRFAFLFAVLSAVADILPVLGPSLIYAPLALAYYLQGDSWTAIAILTGLAILCFARQICEPKIVSDSISIPPLAGIAAAYFALLAKSIWLLFYLILLFMLISICSSIRKRIEQNGEDL